MADIQPRCEVGTRRPSVFLRRLMFSDLPRWKCLCYRSAIGVPLVLALVLVSLTQTVLLKRLIIPALESQVGLGITASRVYVGRSGDLIMQDVVVRVPGVEGPAGKVLQVGRLRANVDWSSVLSGRPRLTTVRLLDPLVRLSQSVDDGSLNLAALPRPKPGSGGPMDLPHLIGRRITLELGEHSGGMYTTLKRLNLDGALVPGGGPGVQKYEIRLHELSPRPGRTGVLLTGIVDQDELSVELTGVKLDDWPAAAVPAPVREQFRRLDLRGEVLNTRFVARGGKWESAKISLAEVGVNLPLPEEMLVEGPPSPEQPPMRMSGVTGDIEFTPAGATALLKGSLEDLPYTVSLKFDGLDPNGAFRMEVVSENFQLARNPDLLPYAPRLVRKRFLSFSSPTGEFDTRLTVTRGPPVEGQPGPIAVSGLVNFNHVDAAYQKFPYRFPDLSGVITFDDEGIELVRISGTAPSGAKVMTTGRIAPPGGDAEVNLEIDVTDLPLDEQVQIALGPKRGEVVPALFNADRYAALVEAGLVLPPAGAAALRDRLGALEAAGDEAAAAEVREQLRVPEFSPGGVARVNLRLHRPRGEDSDWFTTVEVHIPEAGLLVEKFPLPILARDVLVRIDDDRADLLAGSFRALTGGGAEVDVSALLRDPATGERDFRPDVAVTAWDIPIDELLLSALPRGGEADARGDGQGLARSILRGLGATGEVDATARIAHGTDGPLGFRVRADLSGVELNPAPVGDSATLALRGMEGTVEVSDDRLSIDLRGALRETAGGDGDGQAAGRLGVDAVVEYSGDDDDRRWSADAVIEASGFDAAAPVEDFVRVFSAGTADAMGAQRAEFDPRGVVNATARVIAGSHAATLAVIEVSEIRQLALNYLGGRAALDDADGSARFTVTPVGGVTGEFSGLRARLAFGGEPAGILSLDGLYHFGEGMSGAAATDLAVTIDQGRFESALTAVVVREKLPPAVAAWWGLSRPRGEYLQRLALRADDHGSIRTTGVLMPSSFSYTAHGGMDQALVGPPLEIEFPAVHGEVHFADGGGSVTGLVAEAPGWMISGGGQWMLFGAGEVSASGNLSLRSSGLPPDLRAVLPSGVQGVLGSLAVRVNGALSLDNGEFSFARRSAVPGSDATEQTADYSGTLTFDDAALEVGASIRDLSGSLNVQATQPPGGEPIAYDLRLRGDSLDASGVRLTDARARILSGQGGGVTVPLLAARSHGGRVVGQAHLWPESAGAPARTRYDAQFQWSGIRFSPLAADLAAPGADAAAPNGPDDMSRGVFEGGLSLAGTVGEESTRRGRGTMRVSGGRVLRLPLVLRLIEVSNLAPPSNAALDFARASLFIDGPAVVFEEVSVFSSAVQILGYGTMNWPGTELDLRFRTKAAHPIPILGRLIEGVRNELIGTAVTGTVRKPEVRLEQFPATRRLIGRAMGEAPTGPQRQMDDLGEAVPGPERPSPDDAPGVRPSAPESPGGAGPR